jgi:RimJ/RimL family protein N-acetyltransferase
LCRAAAKPYLAGQHDNPAGTIVAVAATIPTTRLSLVPLRAEDADELAVVLGDKRLYEFIGGRPATAGELRDRYARLVAGSGDPDERWLNWVVRVRETGEAAGTVQATVRPASAAVAWVIGVPWQGRGYASEAARALVAWLRGQGATEIVAHIHPEHAASERVAAAAGLRLTGDVVDGERAWRLNG